MDINELTNAKRYETHQDQHHMSKGVLQINYFSWNELSTSIHRRAPFTINNTFFEICFWHFFKPMFSCQYHDIIFFHYSVIMCSCRLGAHLIYFHIYLNDNTIQFLKDKKKNERKKYLCHQQKLLVKAQVLLLRSQAY